MGITGKCAQCKMPRTKIMRYNMKIVYVDNKPIPSSTNSE